MSLSTHVLDAVSGRPATAVPVTLRNADDAVLANAVTDDDGRIANLGDDLGAGVYRLRFDTATYFAAQGITGFYPEIVVAFEITDATARHHVPVLLSPYAYSTYRGS
jgi:5-hydroxyisourate hydrolase